MRAYLSILLLCLLALALTLATTAFAQTPQQPNEATVMAQADAQFKQGQYDLAVKSYSRAIIRGLAYVFTGKSELAIADCDTVLKLDPKNVAAYSTRGWADESLGKHEPAIAEFDAAIKLDPYNDVAYYGRGVSYRALGDTIRSEADLSKAMALGVYGKDAPAVEQADIMDETHSCTVNFAKPGSLIFVKARIGNGKEEYLFTLDTGADVSIISEQLAHELKLKRLDEPKEYPDAFGTEFKCWPCLLDSITLGNCRVENPTFLVADLQPFASNLGLQDTQGDLGGIIGATFLRHYRVTIDYAQQQITFSRTTAPLSGSYLLKAADRLQPVTTQSTIIPIIVDGHAIDVKPDTGSAQTKLPVSFLQNLDYPQQEKLSSNGPVSAGVAGDATINGMLVRIHDLRIGDCHLSDFPVESIANTGVLGVDFLSQFLVTLDYPSNTLALTPVAQQKFDHNLFSTGIAGIDYEQYGLRISGIWENSPAAKAALHPGDLILEINGKQATQSTYAAFDDDNVTSLLLLVESNGAQRSVTLQKAYLFPALPADEQKK